MAAWGVIQTVGDLNGLDKTHLNSIGQCAQVCLTPKTQDAMLYGDG